MAHPSRPAVVKRKSSQLNEAARNVVKARKSKNKHEKGLKAVFKGVRFSLAGKIAKQSGDVVSYEDLVNWITSHGGKYDREVDADTTHLICSIEEYEKRTPQVLKALKHRNENSSCYIVVFDWVEDSLVGRHGSKKKRAEREYTLERTLERLKKGKNNEAFLRQRFEEGLSASKELCDNKLHRIHFDQDGFNYKIFLTRVDFSSEKPKVEKYTLFLFESIAIPHTYMTGAKLSRSYRPISYYRETCHPKTFPEAMRDFKHFFFDKTHIVWDQRLEGVRVPGCFVYTPPAVGMPVGLLPMGYVRPAPRPVVTPESSPSGRATNENRRKNVSFSANTSFTTSTSFSPSSGENTGPYTTPFQPNVFGDYGYQPNVEDFRTPTISPNSSFCSQDEHGSQRLEFEMHDNQSYSSNGFLRSLFAARATNSTDNAPLISDRNSDLNAHGYR